MRSIHIGLCALALALIVFSVWWIVDGRSSELRAASAEQRDDARAHLDAGLEADASLGANGAASASTRVALAVAPLPDAQQAASVVRASPRVHGRVLAPDGTAVADARVWIAGKATWGELPLGAELDGLPKGWLSVDETRTDADGEYRFEGLKPGSKRLAVRAAGYAPKYEAQLELADAPEQRLADVQLERGVILSGTVVDRSGKGVAGASLLVALDGALGSGSVAMPGRGIPVATSAADGAFRVDELAAGPWHLLIDSPAHELSEEEGRTERAGERQSGLVFRLDFGLEITGQVIAGVDAAALPPLLRVSARAATGEIDHGITIVDGQSSPNQVRARHALCAADGKFVLRGLRAGTRYRLTAWIPSGDASAWKRVNGIEALLTQAGERGVELVYKPESALVFRVLDAESGSALAEFCVSAGIGRERLLRNERNEVVRSFPDGRVRCPELRSQGNNKNGVLRVQAAGYADYEDKNVKLVPGQELDLGEIRLAREHTVLVRVLDASGAQPIEDARVWLGAESADQFASAAQTAPEIDSWGVARQRYGRTDARGVVRLSSLPGKLVAVRASAKGFVASAPESVLLPAAADHALELRLARGATVRVHVSDGAGHVLAAVAVDHRRPNLELAGTTVVQSERKTDATGVALFEALAPGAHAFRLSATEGQEQPESAWVELNVGASEPPVIELVAPARGALRGVVREGGRPLANARLKLVPLRANNAEFESWSSGSDPLSASSDAGGRYACSNLRLCTYTLYVNHATRRMAAHFKVDVRDATQVFDVDLGLATIEGHVTDVDGRPLAGVVVGAGRVGAEHVDDQPYQVVVSDDDRGSARINYLPSAARTEKTDASGHYALRGVAFDEPLVVRVRGDMVENASSLPLVVAADEIRRGVDFVLRPAGVLELRLAGDTTPRWYEVHIARLEPNGPSEVRVSSFGSWQRTQSVRGLAVGRYRLQCVRRDDDARSNAQTMEVEIEAGVTSSAVFQAF